MSTLSILHRSLGLGFPIARVLGVISLARWLLTRRGKALSKAELEQIRQIEKGCSEVQLAMEIVRDFSDMIRNRDGRKWEAWLQRTTTSTTLAAVLGFA